MKTPNTQDIEKTASNGKGDLSPKSDKIRCKCTQDCSCPNSKFYKEQTKGDVNKPPQQLKKKVNTTELPHSKCSCSDRKEATKGKKNSKSKIPCSKDKDCSCTLPNALSLRSKITDLDNALKSHGRGNKRKTKNIQQKSTQISEIYEDPETKRKSIITLTEKSQVKIEIKTFCDDTSKLEKNKKKKKRRKSIDDSSKSSKSDKKTKENKQKKEKEHKGRNPKEKHHKDKNHREKPRKNKNRGFFRYFKKKHPVSATNSYGSHKISDVSLVYQTGTNSCKDGPCLGIKTFSKTERVGEGIVNTNTVVFPENFTGNLNQLNDCHTCKGITDQLNHQTQEIDDLRRSITECLKILKSSGQTVYMMNDMFERANPNYFTVYSHASDKYHRQSARDRKVSEYTYDPEHKVRDWITHGSLKHHQHRDRDGRSHTHRHGQLATNSRDQDIKASGNKGSRIPDKFDTELEDYLRICRQEYQVYKTAKEEIIPKGKKKKSKSKISKETSKKTKKSEGKSKKSKKGSENVPTAPLIQGPQCDRDVLDCQCGSQCENLAVQTSNISTDQSKSIKDEKKARKEARKSKTKKTSKTDINTDDLSNTTEKSEGGDSSASAKNKNKEKSLKAKDPKLSKIVSCMGKFIKCVLCRPY